MRLGARMVNHRVSQEVLVRASLFGELDVAQNYDILTHSLSAVFCFHDTCVLSFAAFAAVLMICCFGVATQIKYVWCAREAHDDRPVNA